LAECQKRLDHERLGVGKGGHRRVNKEDIFKQKEAKLAKEGTRNLRRDAKLNQPDKREAPLAGRPAAIP
jgi:hypothetical protein